ncbi:MarR family transcription regulator [Salinarchaeum sp. Harcht-Bsk1]|uniref:winged helix-turn-helix transcriptional regulator n=1 Tax=Salinarchaeum sp. Harcht-Bsk1 TaxID=1333523 RepID=UPI0003423036|nr:MarR family transcriptional regulator [Salinarchaeum sp. Harcht-Bsk1]AGN01739.1 MarR family transcription regulator [Salinarchaeum sp. Harcht-Bsk1]
MTDRGVDEDKRATLRRFAALGATIPAGLAASGSAAAEGSDAREALVGYLSATPGAHFSKVRDDLRLGTGETQHHLRQLIDDGAIVREDDGDYARYYPAATFSAPERTALAALRKETPRAMVLALLREPGQSGASLAESVGVSRPTISRQAASLEADGLLERDDGYRLQQPETVLALVVRYADSFDADAVALAGEADGLIAFDP